MRSGYFERLRVYDHTKLPASGDLTYGMMTTSSKEDARRPPQIIYITMRPNGDMISAEYLDCPGSSDKNLAHTAYFEFIELTHLFDTPYNDAGEYSTEGEAYTHDGMPAILQIVSVAQP
jgi:hypothetical protein